MTRTHRAVLVAGLIALALSCVWVPWYVPGQDGTYLTNPNRDAFAPATEGYAFVWNLPVQRRGRLDPDDPVASIPDLVSETLVSSTSLSWGIDYRRLYLSWLMIAALMGGAYLAVGFRRETPPKHGEDSNT